MGVGNIVIEGVMPSSVLSTTVSSISCMVLKRRHVSWVVHGPADGFVLLDARYSALRLFLNGTGLSRFLFAGIFTKSVTLSGLLSQFPQFLHEHFSPQHALARTPGHLVFLFPSTQATYSRFSLLLSTPHLQDTLLQVTLQSSWLSLFLHPLHLQSRVQEIRVSTQGQRVFPSTVGIQESWSSLLFLPHEHTSLFVSLSVDTVKKYIERR